MTEGEIKAAARIFIIAGSETTATLLSGAFFHLLTHPEYLSRLTHEIRTAFLTESEIDIQSTGSLPFLQAVIQESLRLYPPTPNTFPRTTPEPGQVICGRFVSAGTAVGVHQWSAHRCKSNFFMPDAFVPERWMNTDDERFRGDERDACQPFSYGPRNCIGQKYFPFPSFSMRFVSS
jgi:cytochrome P450